jgi:hypothetical protein
MIFDLNFCRTIPYSRGAHQAVKIFRAQGATFLRAGSSEPVTDPTEFRDEKGLPFIEFLDVYHQLLVPERQAPGVGDANGAAQGSGGFGVLDDVQGVVVSQAADFVDSTPPDLIATGLLALSTHMYPHLRPMYGWVDEFGWNLPDGKALASPNPKYLFWANFFGPERVKAMGREFLKCAPGWVSVDLPDGGILHVSTESYKEWWESDQPDLLAYFRRKFPKVQIYRAQPIPY